MTHGNMFVITIFFFFEIAHTHAQVEIKLKTSYTEDQFLYMNIRYCNVLEGAFAITSLRGHFSKYVKP